MSFHTKLEPARKTDRKRVIMTGTLITCEGSKRVRIRDFSNKGAQVVLEDGEVAQCDVLLKRGDLCAAAKVAWIKGDEVGLTFYREISPKQIAGS
jgi:hypothetical protein